MQICRTSAKCPDAHRLARAAARIRGFLSRARKIECRTLFENRPMPSASHERSGIFPARHFSLLATWAVAFGCAVGWDSFVLPWTEFLPMAGPLGTAIAILLAACSMGIIAWNYHAMINRHPGPGGVYAYATETFGADHGFICAWFICFTYMAIVWMDATILAMIAHGAFGTFFDFGFRYSVGDHTVRLGHILLSVTAIAAAAAVCCRRALSRVVQTVLALLFLAGVAVCFLAALRRHAGGLSAMAPAFAPGGQSPVEQVARLIALGPWLFVGFESVSHLSGEFRFPRRQAFGVMAAALGTAVLAYLLLSAIPVLVSGASGWPEAVAGFGDHPTETAFAAAAGSLGKAGTAIVAATLLASVFTNLVGNTLAASRLIAAMAEDRVLPGWFSRRTADGAPYTAVFSIALLSLAIIVLGHRVIGIIVDLALVGAAVTYAYTSAAAFTAARAAGDRITRATGIAGIALAVMAIALYVLPGAGPEGSLMATHSYLVVVLWCLAGLLCFLHVFRLDSSRRFGQSTIVWISLLAVILFMALMWIREETAETTRRAFDDITAHHAAIHEHHGEDPTDWHDTLRAQFEFVNRTILRDNFVQVSLTVLAFALMIALFSVLRRRELGHELEKARAKSYFFSTVSHDIRTPLNAIIGFSEMLKAGSMTGAEREQALDSIVVSGRTLLGLVNDVLDLSKLESGKMEIHPEPTDCHRLLHGVVDAFRVSGSKPGVDLRCHVGEMPPLMLDPQRLRQIVFNIVGNAVKFTDKGFVEVRAKYEREGDAETGTFRLEVEDTGCGIAQEDLKHIGSAYVQLGTKVSRNGGTGLGLAICNQLAAAMGGRLGVESEQGCGSTFRVELPGVKAAEAPAHAETGPEEKPAAPAAVPHSVKRILLVDDSKINLMVLQAHLKHIGRFDIALAADGRIALDILQARNAKPFDLVLTDMWMPVMDGIELFKAIRADPALAGLRVVIVTADVELQAKAERMGFDGILLKPVTSAQIAKIISDTAG
jgi:signal transduction histidine kinase/CheY-like chemotaxis protein